MDPKVSPPGAGGAKVGYHDPHVDELDFDGARYTSRPRAQALADTDCEAIVTNHAALDVDEIQAKAPLVIDTRNATKGRKAAHVQKL